METKKDSSGQRGVLITLVDFLVYVLACLIELPSRISGCAENCPECGEGILIPQDMATMSSLDGGLNIPVQTTSSAFSCSRCGHTVRHNIMGRPDST